MMAFPIDSGEEDIMKVLFNSSFNAQNIFRMKNFAMGANFNENLIQPIEDKVVFTGNVETHKINVDKDTAEFVANSLLSSESGYMAKYPSDKFNAEVVELLTLGVAKYVKDRAKEENETPTVAIGGDTRKATRDMLPMMNDIFTKQGVGVLYAEKPMPTPLFSKMIRAMSFPVSVLMTAGDSPWSNGGYNLLVGDEAIAPESVTKEVAKNILEYANQGYYTTNKKEEAYSDIVYPYSYYQEKIDETNLIDWYDISYEDISIIYDCMEGVGDYVFPLLLRDKGIEYTVIDADRKIGPKLTSSNLHELKRWVRDDKARLKVGLANDGDAGRLGVVDEKGNFVSPNDVMLLVTYHLVDNKGKTGSIIKSQAVSSELDLFAKSRGLKVIETPVGFKYISEEISKERKEEKDVLIAGDETGGLTVCNQIPEKDGIIANLLIIDLIAKEKMPLSDILEKVKSSLGVEFRTYDFSKKLDNAKQEAIMRKVKDIYSAALSGNTKFGDFEIDVEKTRANMDAMEHCKKGGDGVKLFMTDGSSILVRKSGTEPKIDAYIETCNKDADVAEQNLSELKAKLVDIFDI